jgi:hypothetical protein
LPPVSHDISFSLFFKRKKVKIYKSFSNSHFSEVEVEVKVEDKKKCLKSTVLTEKYGKFHEFSLTLALTWQFSK